MLPEKLLKCAIAQFSRTFKIRCKVQACYEYPPRRDQAHAILFISKLIPKKKDYVLKSSLGPAWTLNDV